ncbi:hypothetical protein BKA66DRAFT_576297 [Pyrenochaeta sp. MPI-SDFR-AT-0127]|nr:hypothetical protein BKA66DRAFT_576297 [Pyrenochaeta sp. MPI-SDFR-AT-0127]
MTPLRQNEDEAYAKALTWCKAQQMPGTYEKIIAFLNLSQDPKDGEEETADPILRLTGNNIQSAVQYNQGSQSIDKEHTKSYSLPTASQSVALRFSFAGTAEETPTSEHQSKGLHQSFSELVMHTDTNKHASGPESHGGNTTLQSVQETTYLPALTKPKKIREGYGFSYSETFWCDSDEYPDTECDWEPEEQTTEHPENTKRDHEWGFANQTAQASFGGSTVVATECSFDDVVVMRDVGSFHIARPQKALFCTKATREDTILLKNQAKVLLGMYTESGDIQAQMLSRLERMVYNERQKEDSSNRAEVSSVTLCVLKLRDFLLKVKEDRIDTGEHRRLVEHEIEWARWLVEASYKGVMHLKVPGCKCRPDWEEE